jgi:YIF1
MLVHTRWTGLVAGKPKPQVPHFTNGMQPQQDDYFGQAAPMAAQFGVNMVQTTIGKYLPFASALWQSLRYYFDVNNTYVQNKLRILLAPFRHKHWQRLPANESGGMQQDVYNPVCAFAIFTHGCGGKLAQQQKLLVT